MGRGVTGWRPGSDTGAGIIDEHRRVPQLLSDGGEGSHHVTVLTYVR